ncbi:hypothetical protein [Rhizobium sp. BK176]|uniref:hypothetical protein n=1 Tax=Rhizobium sp. BK176 TaxID=2587071 RepID=UPI0021690632|nr:hypothetical protein [Rhizobium sp. BK176]MCS4088924.1 hypothetical protein [Rhizobium sp. BK176]
MIIDVPFEYSVSGIEPRCRNPSGSTGYDQVRVNIRDIHESDAPVALELLDEDGGPAETFRHFEGGFWIRNSRDEDVDFGKQHIMLMGYWPMRKKLDPGYHENRRNFKAYTQAEAERDNAKAVKGLSLIGILRYNTTSKNLWYMVDNDLQPREPFYQRPDGIIDCAVVDGTIGYREVTKNDINEKRQKTVEYAQSSVIAIDGELWHRAPVPMIYATDKAIHWAFDGTLNGKELSSDRYSYMNDKADMMTVGAYKMAMTEYDTIPDHFPDAIEKQRVKFHIRYIDQAFFEKPDLKPLIVKDIEASMSECDLHRDSASYIHKWLQLRDLVRPVRKSLDSQSEEFLDMAADLMLELDAMAGRNRFPGATMWVNRQVDLGGPSAPENKPHL